MQTKKSRKQKIAEAGAIPINPEDFLYVKINKMLLALHTIQRLMPEVEAELSRMGAVGAPPGKN